MSELVSIVITAYNGGDYLIEAVESIFKQTYTNWELILVNDGSKDDTLKLMEKYAVQDNRIKVLSHENKGISYSNNRALEIAKGKYYAKLDADDRMLPNRLEKQVTYLQNHPEVTMLSCQAHYINPKGKRIGIQITPGYTSIEESKEAREEGRLIIALHSGFMTYMDKIKEVKGYREDLPCVVDLDLYNRMIEKGNVLIILGDKLVEYRMHLASVMALTTRNNQTQHVKSWLSDTYKRRVKGEKELSLDEFKSLQAQASSWNQWKRRTKEMAYHHRRNSIIHYGDNSYLPFVYSVGMATLLQPIHTLSRVGAWLKRKLKK
jgi:glycosyltransferase involved in cell wall biosynthesis